MNSDKSRLVDIIESIALAVGITGFILAILVAHDISLVVDKWNKFIPELYTDVSDLANDFSKLNMRVTTLKAAVDNINNKLRNLDERVFALEVNYANMEKKIVIKNISIVYNQSSVETVNELVAVKRPIKIIVYQLTEYGFYWPRTGVTVIVRYHDMVVNGVTDSNGEVTFTNIVPESGEQITIWITSKNTLRYEVTVTVPYMHPEDAQVFNYNPIVVLVDEVWE